MNRDSKIDMLLKTFCELKTISIPFGELYSVAFGEAPDDSEQLRERLIEQETIKEFMKNYGLMEGTSGDFPNVYFKVSVKGREIYESGGWIIYLKDQKSKERKIDGKDNKRFAITTIISLAAILFSIYQAYTTNDLKIERDKLSKQIDSLKLELRQKEALLKGLQKEYKLKDTITK